MQGSDSFDFLSNTIIGTILGFHYSTVIKWRSDDVSIILKTDLHDIIVKIEGVFKCYCFLI
ncbi:MAG: hypothetical protein EU547_03275 [Promethearchaeota archaeon]|nr:MAG: hypothetical protein EU547_03275 [Candidatus Lokiarchaeota archaeon]